MRKPAALHVRQYIFWSQVRPNLVTWCWEWEGHAIASNGYGMFMLNGRTVPAHRLAYEWEVGPIPSGLHVLHSCDNPRCVNPSHLSVGTREDNMRDMVRKGRHVTGRERGDRHHNAKLTQAKVDALRVEWPTLPRGQKARVRRELGVSETTIHAALTSRTWRRLPQ